MANPTPQPLSALAAYTTYHPVDPVMILDTTDLTFGPTGTNKQVPFPTLLAMAGIPGSIVSGNIAGNAAGITGTVAGSQVSGNIAGNAASITGSIAEGQVTGLAASLAALATIASPSFTGTVTLPTGLSGLLKAAAGVVSTATAGTDYLTPSGSGASLTGITGAQIAGNIAGNAASITGSIAGSQVSGNIAGSAAGNVALAPGSSTQNWITSAGDYTTLALQPVAGQVSNLLEIENSSGVKTAWIGPNASIYFPVAGFGGTTAGSTCTVGTGTLAKALNVYQQSTSGTNYGGYFTASGSGAAENVGVYAIASGSALNIALSATAAANAGDYAIYTSGRVKVVGAADAIQLIVAANSTQTNHLQEWWNAGGSPVAFIDAAGSFTAVAGTFSGALGATVGTFSGGAILSGGYGAHGASTSMMTLGGVGTSPNAGSIAFGDGTGWQINFGPTISGTFTPKITFTDSGVISAKSLTTTGATLTQGSNHITFGSAAPSSGTWVQGDICFNTAVTATTTPAWSCTVGGTPGTWVAHPVL